MDTLHNKTNLPGNLLYLTKLFLCLIALAIIIALVMFSLTLLLTPLGVMIGWYTVNFFTWQIDTSFEAILLSGIGLLGGLCTWFVFKGLARLLGPAHA
ncbi:MAG: hypothetical protein HY869_01660 [Chloroflexi bacterium]|nr:hypothetical protein [Chloroflexota bacterium]